jgi:hypothetical protein
VFEKGKGDFHAERGHTDQNHQHKPDLNCDAAAPAIQKGRNELRQSSHHRRTQTRNNSNIEKNYMRIDKMTLEASQTRLPS